MSFLEFLFATVSTLGGLAVAWRITPRPRTCSCGHGLGMHDPKRGCTIQRRRKHYDRSGIRFGHEYATCPCLRFDGTASLPAPRED